MIKKTFMASESMGLAKSRRYSILKGDKEIDGLNAVLLFIETGIDYRYLKNMLKKRCVLVSHHNPKLYDFPLLARMMAINISKFLHEASIVYDDFFQLIGLDPYRGKLLLGRGEALPLSTCLKIESYFGVALPLWFSEHLDIDCLVANWKAPKRNKMHMPKQFNIGLGSKMRLFESAVGFVNKELGATVVDDVLSVMQLERSLFHYPDKDISINVFKEFHRHMRKYGADDDFYIRMGEYNVYSNKISKIDFTQRLSPEDSRDAYLKLGSFITPRVDKNFWYRSHEVSGNEVLVNSEPRQTMIDLTGEKIIGSYEVALYRFGHILGFPLFFGLKGGSREQSSMSYNPSTDEANFNIHLDI